MGPVLANVRHVTRRGTELLSGGRVVKLSLKDLLKRALMVDAQEVRLIPGRRTVVVTSQGENEVRGDPQTPDRINALLEEVLTAEARRSLATGCAEWDCLWPDEVRGRAA